MFRKTLFLAILFYCTCSMHSFAIAEDEIQNHSQIERIEYLVKLLASKNQKPDVLDFSPPEKYSREAQVAVYLARQQLANEGSAACDELIKHLDDTRYSFTYDAPSGLYNKNVGATCHELFLLIVCCYKKELGLLTSKQNGIHLEIAKDPVTWWKANRNRPLWEIQVEQIDLATTFFTELNYEDAPPHPPSPSQKPREQFEIIRKHNLSVLKQLRDKIALTKQAHVTTSIDTPFAPMTWLPWYVDSSNGK